MRPTLVLFALSLVVPVSARADLRAQVVAVRGGALVPGPVHARVGETVELGVALRTDRRAALVPLPAGAQVRWLRIEPRMEHVDLPAPNGRIRAFSNNVLTGPRHGRWLGYDTLEYETHPLVAARDLAVDGARVTLRAARPRQPERDRYGGAGSIWIAAEVTLPDGTVLQTPAANDADRLGLRPSVMRVSFRLGDDYLGWLSTYFQVPNLFGSNGSRGDHQTDRYVGADCADVLVGALRASGRREVQYTSVSGIGRYATATTGVLGVGQDGVVRDATTGAAVELRWGRDVAPGDLMTIDYTGATELPRAWDHIAALVSDRGVPGVVDAGDVIRHMTHQGLDDRPIAREAPVRVRFWRWKPVGNTGHGRGHGRGHGSS